MISPSPPAPPCCLNPLPCVLAGKPLHSAAMWAERRRPKKTFVHLRATALVCRGLRFTQCWTVCVVLEGRDTVAATVEVPFSLLRLLCDNKASVPH